MNASGQLRSLPLRSASQHAIHGLRQWKFPNADFALAQARRIDPQNRVIDTEIETIFYDYLILATGSTSYSFGIPDVDAHAFSMKGSWKADHIPEILRELNASKKHLGEEVFGHLQKAFLLKALKTCGGNISRAAEKVGMKRPNFYALLKKHRISDNHNFR